MSTTIAMRLAYDQNQNRSVEKEEIIRQMTDLSSQDQDGDGKLQGNELKDVFYEYGQDQWLPGDRTSYQSKDGWRTSLRLNSIDLQAGSIDLNINMKPR